MKFTKMLKKSMILVFVGLIAISLVGCKKEKPDTGYTYRTYTAVSPSNWNELTYQDENDTQIMSYIGSNFYGYNFKFDQNGEIVAGDFSMEYSAATKLEDVTSQYVGEKWGISENETGRAYKITLRDDLKWDDGTPIDATDFEYSMQEQLNPLFQNYRADSYYDSSLIIHNAKAYLKQGQSGLFPAVDLDEYGDDLNSFDGLYFDASNVKAFNYIFSTSDLNDLNTEKGKKYFQVGEKNILEDLLQYSGDKRTPMTQEISDKLASLFSEEGQLGAYWNWADSEIGYFAVAEYTYPAVNWEDVGFKADGYEITLILDNPIDLLKEDGSLSYKAAYNMSSLPLVKKDLYEKCKIAPTSGTTLWTSNYNSNLETTASWGPYKLTKFQSGKEYVLEKNENWFGYSLAQYEGQYQTTKIVCETIAEWNTAWLKFLSGEIDGIGIDVSVADDYKNSERAYYTPDDYIASLQIQSNESALKSREEEGYDKEILANADFRKALSLSINRTEFASKTTTSSKAGYGIFNSMHYYDVENSRAYRDSDEAKKVLCEVYGLEYTDETLDSVVASITGYDLTLARELVDKAYDKQIADGKMTETDIVKITFGTSVVNEVVTRRYNFIMDAWKELVKGTKLEGKLEFDEIKEFSDSWATDFRNGAYDVTMGGWTGGAWDPGYFLLAYLGDNYRYAKAWDPTKEKMTFTMVGVKGEDGNDITDTLTLMEWYYCLNGLAGCKYDFSSNALEDSQRLQLIAALEKEILLTYYTLPLYNTYGASLLSYKVDYITYDYNTFMAYGGIRYLKYNYNNDEWKQLVKKNNGEINYK